MGDELVPRNNEHECYEDGSHRDTSTAGTPEGPRVSDGVLDQEVGRDGETESEYQKEQIVLQR